MIPPLRTHLTVLPDWIDYNGHMNVTYYVLACDMATDRAYEKWGIGESYLERGFSVYTLGMNVDYIDELHEGDPITIITQMLDVDYKRIHYIHELRHGKTDVVAATNECLGMNIDLATKKSTPFPSDTQATLDAVLSKDKKYHTPPQAFRKLGIRR